LNQIIYRPLSIACDSDLMWSLKFNQSARWLQDIVEWVWASCMHFSHCSWGW